jgi:hypothetical protein
LKTAFIAIFQRVQGNVIASPYAPPPCLPAARGVARPARTNFDHFRDREAVREHYRLGAAVARAGEQFERAAAIGLGAAPGSGHWRVIGWRLF